MNNMDKKLREYMKLPYTVTLKRDEEGDVIARIKELEGCVADGQDEMEAIGNLEQVKEFWLTAAIKAGRDIPYPYRDEELPSGKWLTRAPRSLHKKLTELAEREGVSLNQLVVSCLAEAVSQKSSARQSNDSRAGTLESVQALSHSYKPYKTATTNIVTFPATNLPPVSSWNNQRFLESVMGPSGRFTFPEHHPERRSNDREEVKSFGT